MKIAAAYGVRQQDREIALPAVFVIDARNKIRWEKVGENPADRPTLEDLVSAIARAR